VIPLLNVDVNLANKTKSSDLRTNGGSGEGDSATDISSVDETESIGTDDSDNISTLPSLDDDDDLEVDTCYTFVVLLTSLCFFMYLLGIFLLFWFNISSFNILLILLPLFIKTNTRMCMYALCAIIIIIIIITGTNWKKWRSTCSFIIGSATGSKSSQVPRAGLLKRILCRRNSGALLFRSHCEAHSNYGCEVGICRMSGTL
jgi:hypothetical protein